MKVIICGSRHFQGKYDQIESAIKLSGFDVTEIVEGGAEGVDTYARMYARMRNIDCVTFHANWGKHPKAAGPLRNRRMAAYADACIALPGGRGTADMVTTANELGLAVYDAAGKKKG